MSSDPNRIASALERIAEIQEKMLVETEAQTEYLLRSEKQRNQMDAIMGLFYVHTFKRDGFEFVRDGNAYRTVPIEEYKFKRQDDEVRAAVETLRKALEKFTVKGPDLT